MTRKRICTCPLNSCLRISVPVMAMLVLSVALAAPVRRAAETEAARAHAGEEAQKAQGPLLHFAKAASYSSGASIPYDLVVADLNGDGNPDVVVANECAAPDCAYGSIGVLLGNGDGTFQPATTFDAGGEPFALGAGDVNNDGNPDVVVLNASGMVSVLLGNGDGTFQAPLSYDSGGAIPEYGGAVAAADVNGDGNLDLIATNRGGTVGVLLGNGDGTFQAAVNYSTGGYNPVSFAVGDVNGDGRLDLVVANRDSSSVSVLLGNGDGTFEPPVSYSSGGDYPQSVALADVNGDGHLDLAVANGCKTGKCPRGGVSILLGNGDGTFQSPSGFNSVTRYAFSIAVEDVNGDGKPDLVVVSSCPPYSPYYYTTCNYSGDVSVLAGNGDGTFQAPVNYYPGGWFPLSVAIADLRAIGKPDLLVTSICGFDNCAIGSIGALLNDFMAKTTIQMTSSPNPSLVGQPVSFTVTITSNPPIPDGEAVTFYSAKTTLGTGATVNGVATMTTSFSQAKTYNVRASYAGDLYHKARSVEVKQVVEQ